MNNKYSNKTKEQVLEKCHCGERIAVIAKEFKISRTTIYRWIREHDNNIPKRNKKVDMKTFHELERMYQRQKKIIQILQSSPCLVNSPLDIKIETIDKMVSDEFTINTLCEALCVPKGTYYNRKLRGKQGYTAAMRKRDEIKPVIKEIFDDSNQIYGPGKVHAILKDRGYTVSINVVASIMHDNNWFSIRGGAKALYEINLERKENLLKQQFTVSRPNEV
jgi:transposase-like protein